MTASARQRSKGVPHLPKPAADTSPCDHESTTATVGQRPCPAPRSRMGEEAATPGQPVALARIFWIPPGNSPSRITGCRWLCRNHPASSGTFTFRCTHSPSGHCASQHKKDLPLCRSCGGRDFPVEDRGKLRSNVSQRIPFVSSQFLLHRKDILWCDVARAGQSPRLLRDGRSPTGHVRC